MGIALVQANRVEERRRDREEGGEKGRRAVEGTLVGCVGLGNVAEDWG